MAELNDPIDTPFDLEAERPRTRSECAQGPRPCPWIGCRWHLAEAKVSPTGELRILHRSLPQHVEPSEVEAITEDVAEAVVSMEETCALDVIDREPDGATLDGVGRSLGLTRERIRQIETRARQTLRPRAQRVR